MDGAGARRATADAELSGQLGLADGGEPARFLVIDVDEADVVLTADSVGQGVDRVARHAENLVYTGFGDQPHQDIAYVGHRSLHGWESGASMGGVG